MILLRLGKASIATRPDGEVYYLASEVEEAIKIARAEGYDQGHEDAEESWSRDMQEDRG